jgi:hypothetical protein
MFPSRTECACVQCQQCCREQPGHLLPGDMETIAAHLQQPLAEVKKLFWASPGAVVMNSQTSRQFRIGTITPRYDRRKKRCVFLTEEGQCSIHAVAPFGCAYFDTHQSKEYGKTLSMWGLRKIQDDPAYKTLRDSLPFAESYRPKGY